MPPLPGVDMSVRLVDTSGSALFPTAAVNADSVTNPATSFLDAGQFVWNDTSLVWVRNRAVVSMTDALGGGTILPSVPYLANVANNAATSVDRQRNNFQVQVQAQTLTTAQTINTDIVNFNGRFLWVSANVSIFNGGTLTLTVQAQDAAGNFVAIPGATTGAVASGGPGFQILVGPNTWPANTATAFYANWPTPRLIRLVQTVATASMTYSLAYSPLV